MMEKKQKVKKKNCKTNYNIPQIYVIGFFFLFFFLCTASFTVKKKKLNDKIPRYNQEVCGNYFEGRRNTQGEELQYMKNTA